MSYLDMGYEKGLNWVVAPVLVAGNSGGGRESINKRKRERREEKERNGRQRRWKETNIKGKQK